MTVIGGKHSLSLSLGNCNVSEMHQVIYLEFESLVRSFDYFIFVVLDEAASREQILS